MELLAGLLGGGPCSVDVTVNGQPLSTLMTQLAATLKDQQSQLAQLRDYTYRTDEAMWTRIAVLEDGVTRVNRDLGFEQRLAAGTLGTRSTHGAIEKLEKDVGLLDAKRRGAATAAALAAAEKLHMRMRYYQWVNALKRNKYLRIICSNNSQVVRESYFAKWELALRLAKKKRALANAVEVLERFNGNRLKRHCYEQWIRWREHSLKYRAERHIALVRAVESMRSVSVRGFLRRKWLQWMQAVAKRRMREDQRRAALRMAAVSSRSIVRRYFSQWINVEGQHNLRRRQMRTATALAVQSARLLAGRAFSKWVMVGKRKKQRRMGLALIPRMAHEASVRLASKAYVRMWRYAMLRREERSRSQLEDMTRDLTRRFENLSGQVAGTMNQTQETVTALQKLSQQQAVLEQQQQAGANNKVRNPTPPGRRQSPTVVQRSGSAANLQQLAAQTSPPPAPAPVPSGGGDSLRSSAMGSATAPPTAPQQAKMAPFPQQTQVQQLQNSTGPQGDNRPSGTAMQIGTHVSQISMRGGGSGELTRVVGGSRSGSSAGGSQQQQQQQQPGMP